MLPPFLGNLRLLSLQLLVQISIASLTLLSQFLLLLLTVLQQRLQHLHGTTSSSTCPSRVLHHARTLHVLQELSVPVCVGAVVAGHFLLQRLDE